MRVCVCVCVCVCVYNKYITQYTHTHCVYIHSTHTYIMYTTAFLFWMRIIAINCCPEFFYFFNFMNEVHKLQD